MGLSTRACSKMVLECELMLERTAYNLVSESPTKCAGCKGKPERRWWLDIRGEDLPHIWVSGGGDTVRDQFVNGGDCVWGCGNGGSACSYEYSLPVLCTGAVGDDGFDRT